MTMRPASAMSTVRLAPIQSSTQAKAAAPRPAVTAMTIPNFSTSSNSRPKASTAKIPPTANSVLRPSV